MIYFFNPYGQITKIVKCPFDEASYIANEYEQWFESEEVVTDTTHFISNLAIVPFPKSPGEGWIWDWKELNWVLSEASFDTLKLLKRKEIDKERDKNRYSGITFKGNRFDSDPVSLSNLIGWVTGINSGIGLPPGFTWRSEDNQDIPMSVEDVLGLAETMLLQSTLCYKKSWELKEQLNQINTYQELVDFNIYEGWNK